MNIHKIYIMLFSIYSIMSFAYSYALDIEDIEYVKLTGYTLCPEETGGNKYPWIGAFNTSVIVGDCAVSRDLFKRGWKKGYYVMINEKFIVRINDLMPPKKRKHIDIVFKNKKQAYHFGKKFKKVKLIKKPRK